MNLLEKLTPAVRKQCTTDLAAAELIMASPRPGIISDEWAAACSGRMLADHPAEAAYARELAELYLTGDLPGLAAKSAEERESIYTHPVRTKRSRGRLAGVLARCWRVYGDRRYLDGCIENLRELSAAYPRLSALDPAPMAHWHPGYVENEAGHATGHVAENLSMVLPFIRTDLPADDAAELLGLLWRLGDFCHRCSRVDIVNNIPFHETIGALLIALAVPEFGDAAAWEQTAVERIQYLFAGPRGITRQGYTREGFSYQRVNHNLIMRACTALRRCGREVPPSISRAAEEALEFAAATVRNDGHVPRVGDGVFSGFWEHDIEQHEYLFLAAAEFGRQDLLDRAGTARSTGPAELIPYLMGAEGYARWQAMTPPVPEEKVQACHDLHFAGYQVAGAGRGLGAHYGLLNYANDHNHAHFDHLSIDIAGYDRPLIVDPGTYRYEAIDEKERYHSLPRLIRLRRAGPRIEGYDSTGTLFAVYDNPYIKACGAWHALYEGHRCTRIMTLCLPAGDAGEGDLPGFWVIADTISRTRPAMPGEEQVPIHELTETYFNFYAPGTELGIDQASRTCWTRYDPAYAEVEVIRNENFPSGQRYTVNKEELHRIFDYPDSDANIQVTGFFPEGHQADINPTEAFLTLFGGRCLSPGAGFRWRGPLPHRAVYILVPFRGLTDVPYCTVTGAVRDNGFRGEVILPSGRCTISLDGLDGSGGTIRLQAGSVDTEVKAAPRPEHASRLGTWEDLDKK